MFTPLLQTISVSFAPLTVIMLISFFVMILIYIFSHLTSNDRLIALFKTEFSELITFTIIFVVVLGVIDSGWLSFTLGNINNLIFAKIIEGSNINQQDPSFPPANYQDTNPRSLRIAALDSVRRNQMLLSTALSEHIEFSRELSYYGSVTNSIPFLSSKDPGKQTGGGDKIKPSDLIQNTNPSSDAVITLSFCRGFQSIAGMMTSLTTLASAAITAIYFENVLIDLLTSESAVIVMLAIGFVLRVNPLTRGAGAFFLGLGVGLYTVMPFSILLMNDVTYGFYTNVVFESPNEFSTKVSDFYDDLKKDFSGFSAIKAVFFCSPGKVNSYSEKVASAIRNTEYQNNGGGYNYADIIITFPFIIILAQALSLLTFVSIVGGISKAFGAEISPYVIGRLVYYLKGV